ncbi:hypothetical protein LOTGIDRAFT_232718 [Lottia gigantea]|uniref:EGF-like domain-containing protein n=1 Tax=Lottia gigantea TaxID=225164 RepID=V4A935_LOTGI|nr:hypothetical protein LOTGIDRAFT_232718 [Lottia gigantea]ESO93277.1 hypothetical protein LOTGIDRAFT_232718 [Lottia gigantea]
MGAWRFLLVTCLPFVVYCHNHGVFHQDNHQIGRNQEPIVTPEYQIPSFPHDGRRCVSFARQTKVVDIQLPYLCLPGKPGGVPIPQRNDKQTATTLLAMYWNGWRVCKHEVKMPMNNYVKVSTCCPGWEAGPTGDCTLRKQEPSFHSPCKNGGFLAPDSRVPRCVCPPGFKGLLCQTPCPMALNRLVAGRLSNSPFMKHILPRMRNLINIQTKNLMRGLGPRNIPLGNPYMPTMMRRTNPFSVPGIMGASMSKPMTLLNIMAMKELLKPRRKSVMRISKIIPLGVMSKPVINQQTPQTSDTTDKSNPMYRVNILDNSLPNQNQNLNQEDIPQHQETHPATQPQPVNVHSLPPQYTPQEFPQPTQQQIPNFNDKHVNGETSCKDILKMGITRCVQEAGIDALPEDIFESTSPQNEAVVQQICSLRGNQLSSCIMAGQNACGNGIQISITRRMLLEFISSVGQKCNQPSNPIPPVVNLASPQTFDINRMGPMYPYVTPHASMVPLPPASLRSFIGKNPFLPLQQNRIMPVPPIGHSEPPVGQHVPIRQPATNLGQSVPPMEEPIQTIECFNNGYAVMDNGQQVCECPEDFSGDNCEIAVCESECMNGGNCEAVAGTTMCICAEGFIGLQCEEAEPELTEADITALVDDSVLAQDTSVTGPEDVSQKVIDSYPIPHLPKESPEGFLTTARPLPVEEKVAEMPQQESLKPIESKEVKKLNQEDNSEAVKTEILKADEDFNFDDYPLWMILSVSFGALLLVLLLTTCVCMCVKRRSRRVVTVTTKAAALPEKSPVKDNIYVVGIPPPVYED